jgi:hypothetical protein
LCCFRSAGEIFGEESAFEKAMSRIVKVINTAKQFE